MSALYDTHDVDPSDIAADHQPRSVSGTPSCRGCDDPTCGYCEERVELTREERIDTEREKIHRSVSDMTTLLDDLFVEGYGHRVAEMLRLHAEHDDIAAGDIARDLLIPRITALAKRRAT